MIQKPWGYELLFALSPEYAGKVIFIHKGHRLSFQYHNTKDKTLYVYKGTGLLEVQEKDGELHLTDFIAGQCVRIIPHTKHRVKAIQDMTIFEVSTTELEDVVRVEDDYGRTAG